LGQAALKKKALV